MNIEELTKQLEDVATRLLNDEIDLKIAAEINNGLGKVARVRTAQVAYAAIHSNNANAKKIAFFEAGTTSQLKLEQPVGAGTPATETEQPRAIQ